MRWLVRVLLAIGFVVLCYWGSAQYLVNTIERESYSLLKELKIIRTQKRELENRLRKQQEKVERYLKLQTEVNSINLDIPPRKEITRLVSKLPTLAEKNEVILKSVEYKPLQDVFDKFQSLEFAAPINGSYADIRHFIYELEKMTSTLKINAMTLKHNMQQDNISMQINISAYYQKP